MKYYILLLLLLYTYIYFDRQDHAPVTLYYIVCTYTHNPVRLYQCVFHRALHTNTPHFYPMYNNLFIQVGILVLRCLRISKTTIQFLKYILSDQVIR